MYAKHYTTKQKNSQENLTKIECLLGLKAGLTKFQSFEFRVHSFTITQVANARPEGPI